MWFNFCLINYVSAIISGSIKQSESEVKGSNIYITACRGQRPSPKWGVPTLKCHLLTKTNYDVKFLMAFHTIVGGARLTLNQINNVIDFQCCGRRGQSEYSTGRLHRRQDTCKRSHLNNTLDKVVVIIFKIDDGG